MDFENYKKLEAEEIDTTPLESFELMQDDSESDFFDFGEFYSSIDLADRT